MSIAVFHVNGLQIELLCFSSSSLLKKHKKRIGVGMWKELGLALSRTWKEIAAGRGDGEGKVLGLTPGRRKSDA